VRVVHVLTRTNIGGPSVMLVDLLEGLDPSRVGQTVVRGPAVAAEGDYLAGRHVSAEVVTLGGLRRSIGVVDEARSLVALVRTLRRLRPDVVHTHMAKAGVLGRVAAVLARVPVRVHTYHGHLLHGYFSPIVTRVFVAIERLLRRVTTFVFVVGDTTRRDLLRERIVREDASATIMPAAKPMRPHDKLGAREQLGLARDGVIIGFVGRLTGIKRPDKFLAIAEAIPEANFAVVGNGPLADEVRAKVAALPNVTMVDWNDDVSLVLAALDVVALTSDNEGVPLSLIEAAAAGVPVVTADVGSVREIVVDPTTGFVVRSDAQLTDAVRRLVHDPALRESMGRAAASHIEKCCSMRTYLEAHESLYARLVERNEHRESGR
jgi:glycosyltransferase involved in cell wall biosynthesis